MKKNKKTINYYLENYMNYINPNTYIGDNPTEVSNKQALFIYLKMKKSIVNNEIEELMDIYKEPSIFCHVAKVLIEMTIDKGFNGVYHNNLRKAILEFVSTSRKHMEDTNKQKGLEWELLNDLICLINSTSSFNEAIAYLIYDECILRGVPYSNNNFRYIYNNYLTLTIYDYCVYNLYYMQEPIEELRDLSVIKSASDYLNKINYYLQTYKSDEIFYPKEGNIDPEIEEKFIRLRNKGN